LGGIEKTETGKTIAVADYNGFRIVIPLKEMMITLRSGAATEDYGDMMLRQNKILGNMLGAPIDFIVKGIEAKSRSIAASRKDAMLKKRRQFYLNTDAGGIPPIHEGRIVQARVIAVADKVIRIEVFGIECSVPARDLSWDWIGDAHDRYSVGDEILVRIVGVDAADPEDIAIRVDVKSVAGGGRGDNLNKCRVQGKYAGKVTDIHKGVVFISLANGVNAVAHSCYDRRTPGKKDDVSFAVTHLDTERGVAVGIITRIIKQNL
jgi:ribosomal protein S1